MPKTKTIPPKTNSDALDLEKFRELSRAFFDVANEHRRVFDGGLLGQELLERFWAVHRALNKEIERLGLCPVVDGLTKLEGNEQRCWAIRKILHFVRGLALTGIPLAHPISDMNQLEKAVAMLGTNLSAIEQAIVEVLRKHGPLPGKDIAPKAGYHYDNVRRALASMKRRGIIRHDSDGYYI